MKHTIKPSLFSTSAQCRPVRLRVSFGGLRVDLFSGISYDADKWSTETSRPKPNTKNQFRQSAAEVNRIINEQTAFIDNYFDECEFRKQPPTTSDLKQRFQKQFRGSGKTDETLLDLYDKFLQNTSTSKAWTDNTYKLYRQIRTVIADMKTINAESLDSLALELTESGHNNSTTIFYLKRVKTFARWLNKNGYSDYDPSDYEINLKQMDDHHIVFLESNELDALMKCDIKSETVARVRDIFCFCCFCGLRYCDVKSLKKTDIHNGCINIVTIKTHDPLAIELNQYTRAILDRYADYDDILAFPVQGLKEYNENIREACRLAGIDTPTTKTAYVGARRVETVRPKYDCIASHCARRTFVVQCLTRGIPAEVIIQWTGHKDFDAMKPYFAITNTTRKNAMARFDQTTN